MSSSDAPQGQEPAQSAKREARDCMSCGAPYATAWGTSEGTAWLCRECATLHGLGCP
ncbi:MAG: hypothetical protein RJB57_831 [Actinomycetota bacterium]